MFCTINNICAILLDAVTTFKILECKWRNSRNFCREWSCNPAIKTDSIPCR